MKTIFVALADDHSLIRNGLANLIDTFSGFKVLFQASNGQELIDTLKPKALPDIVLMDINMPKKNGYETTKWLKEMYPQVKVLALSMYDNESAVIRMIKNGAAGYILKDSEPADLEKALLEIDQKGFYHSELVSQHLVKAVRLGGSITEEKQPSEKLSDNEMEFLKLACSELTYKEIADKMFLSPRTIDGYRDALFEKLQVKTRVGLVMYAVKNGIVSMG